MSIHIIALFASVFFQLEVDSYTLGVENGSASTISDVNLISNEIRFSHKLGDIPIGIDREVITSGQVPKSVVVKWRRVDKQFSQAVSIPPDVRQRVADLSRLRVRVLGDNKVVVYVEIVNPLDLTRPSYYPPEFAPKPKVDK